jgi:hypothetical protein
MASSKKKVRRQNDRQRFGNEAARKFKEAARAALQEGGVAARKGKEAARAALQEGGVAAVEGGGVLSAYVQGRCEVFKSTGQESRDEKEVPPSSKEAPPEVFHAWPDWDVTR